MIGGARVSLGCQRVFQGRAENEGVPGRRRRASQTLVQYARVRAVAAADMAAPVEGAVATLRDALRARTVAPATAQ